MAKKQKVSDLPKEEQAALLHEAAESGLRTGLVQGWTVETLKKRIEEKKNGTSEETTEEQTDGETTEETSEETTKEQTDGEIPEDAPDDVKDFLEGKTDELPQNTEVITNKEAEELKQKATPKKETKAEKLLICHICRSKVINGKCTGCGFSIGG